MTAEARIKELGLSLPQPPKPVGNYVPGVRVGNLLFLSGHGPSRVDGVPAARGKVGRDLSLEDGYKVAREVGINLLGIGHERSWAASTRSSGSSRCWAWSTPPRASATSPR